MGKKEATGKVKGSKPRFIHIWKDQRHEKLFTLMYRPFRWKVGRLERLESQRYRDNGKEFKEGGREAIFLCLYPHG